MRKFLVVLFVCLLVLPLAAQRRTGNIYGTVVDAEGNPLPGVNVELKGPTIAPMSAVTTTEGKFRFLSLFPSKEYEVTTKISGFKTRTEKGIIVSVGRNSNITVIMELGAIEEEVTVTAVTPVISPKKTEVTHTVNYDMLQSIPSARDPWVILQMSPGVLVDRENVGGSESGQQSDFYAKGEMTQELVMDGIKITDLNSGGSPGYYDFDAFEEINITTAMPDVEHRQRAIVLDMVTRRGRNKIGIGGRYYLTDDYFEMDPSGKDYESVKEVFSEENGYPPEAGSNRVQNIKDFGFNIGGPLWKDKVWWWGSYGIQQIKTIVITGTHDDTYLSNYGAKLNFTLFPNNQGEIYIFGNEKAKFGRDTTSTAPAGYNQHGKYHWGSPIFKIQDEQMFGDNLFISARWGFTDAGFGMWPGNDEEMTHPRWYDVENDVYKDPWGNIRESDYFFSGRPHQFGVIQAIYYLDDFFGTSHEMKLGAELNNNQRTYVGGYAGNFRFNYNYYTPQIDWDLDGYRDIPSENLRRFQVYRNDVLWYDGGTRQGVYFQDIITSGRFSFNIQVRADHINNWRDEYQTRSLYMSDVDGDWHDNYYEAMKKYMTPQTAAAISALMPDRTLPRSEVDKDFQFWGFSPRLGITFDVFGDGKTIAKLAFAMYPGGPPSEDFWAKGGGYGWMRFWWADAVSLGGNGDEVMDLNELYWAEYQGSRKVYKAFKPDGSFAVTDAMAQRERGLMWSGWDWENPDQLIDPYDVLDPAWKNSRDYDFLASIGREIFTDFYVGLDFTYRWNSRQHWWLNYYPETGHARSKDDYMVWGQVPASLTDPDTGETISTDEAAGRNWYVLKDEPDCQYTDYWYRAMRPDAHDVYYGTDLTWNKRLSHKWMLSGSFTMQMQKYHYGEGYTNPTSIWAFDGQMSSNSMGGSSGKISVPMFTRWMFKIQGMYQLPYDFNISFSMSGREGQLIDRWFYIYDYNCPNPDSYSASIEMQSNDNEDRLPNMWRLDIKLQKMIRVGDLGRVWLSADVFNALNNQSLNRQRSMRYGSYYAHYTPARFYPYARGGEPNESITPLIVRLGLRFQF